MPKTNLLFLASPQDPDLKPLKDLSDNYAITIADVADDYEALLKEFEAAVYWKANPELVRKLIGSAPKLRWLHSCSAGVENILFPEVIESSVVLTNSAGVFAISLAEWVLSAILFFDKDLRRLLRNQAAGCWEQFKVQELRGKTMTIVGFGGIGREIAKRAQAMDIKLIAVRNNPAANPSNNPQVREVAIAALHTVLPETDYLVISAPLTPQTEGLIGQTELNLLKPSALLVNVGRGPIVVEDALVQALQKGRLRGAGLDVFAVEPLPQGHIFYSLENVLLSPHSADHTATWRDETLQLCIANLRRYARGETLQNVVDKNRGY